MQGDKKEDENKDVNQYEDDDDGNIPPLIMVSAAHEK